MKTDKILESLKGYQRDIAELTGIRDLKLIEQIEDAMRAEMPTGTLDHLSKDEFDSLAIRKANIRKRLLGL